MTTAAERLVALAGSGGQAGALLRQIGVAGLTAGALLVAYSGLPTATAAEHLLAERQVTPPLVTPLLSGGRRDLPRGIDAHALSARDARARVARNNDMMLAAMLAILGDESSW